MEGSQTRAAQDRAPGPAAAGTTRRVLQGRGQRRAAGGTARAAGPAETRSHGALSADTGPNTLAKARGAGSWELAGTEAREAGLGGCVSGDRGHRSPSPLGARAGGFPSGRGQPERRPGERMGRRHGRPVLRQVPQEQGPSAGRNRFPEAVAIHWRPESPVPLERGWGRALHAVRPVCSPHGQSLDLQTSLEWTRLVLGAAATQGLWPARWDPRSRTRCQVPAGPTQPGRLLIKVDDSSAPHRRRRQWEPPTCWPLAPGTRDTPRISPSSTWCHVRVSDLLSGRRRGAPKACTAGLD